MKKFFLSLVCVLGIISCSRLDIAVNWADTYIASEVDDYFDLSSQQSKELKVSLKKDIRKVRKEQFVAWADILRRFEADLQKNNLTEKVFHNYFTELMATTKKIQPYFTDSAVQLIATTTPAQLEHFERALRKKNIEDEEKIQNSEKARNETRKKYLRWTDLWMDSLSQNQEKLLNQHLNENPFPLQAQIKNKNYVLGKFQEAKKSPETLKNFVRSYYNDKDSMTDPEYRKSLSSYQSSLEKFILQLIATLDEKQKRLVSENLKEKASSLEKLASQD